MKYIAALDHVLEVTLQGTADLAYWRDRLHAEGLFPAPTPNQRAQVWISGAKSRFRGVSFCELSIAVQVARSVDANCPDGLFLAQAFNSSRLFTFFEKYWFATPYEHSRVEVGRSPYRMSAQSGSDFLLSASLGTSEIEATGPCRPESWEGPLFLPAAGSSSGAQRRHFFARLAGETVTIPFVAPRDRLEIGPTPKFPVLNGLISSGFQGEAWSIRPSAQHARSKTFRE